MGAIVIPASELEGPLLDARVTVCDGDRIAASAMIAIEHGFLIETMAERSGACPAYSSTGITDARFATRDISVCCIGPNRREAQREPRSGRLDTPAQIGPTPLMGLCAAASRPR
jgi:hypothetical protein